MIKISNTCSFKLYTNTKHDNKDKEYKKYFVTYFVICVGGATRRDKIYDNYFQNSDMKICKSVK